MARDIFDSVHVDFRASVRGFLEREAAPLRDQWEEDGRLDRVFWKKAAAQGFVGFEAPEEHGGLGIDDYRFNAILLEETSRLGLLPDHFMLQNDVVGPYLFQLADAEQQARWLPGFTAGDTITAIAMSEPGAGSDLRGIATTATRDGDDYVLNGSKTFISSGTHADLVIVAARTSAEARASGAFSLLVVEDGMDGFERGRKLDKVGRHSQDTSELFFNDVRVPAANLLGAEGSGLRNLMRNLARERLAVSVAAIAGAQHAFDITLEYVKERSAFGTPIGSFQVNRHALAQMKTELGIGQGHLDRCIAAESSHALDHVDAAGLKAWTTETQWKIVDRCLQLHGGYGYMDEYPISRQWRDARVQRIYGGSTEIMWEIVGRSLDL
jgi:acyl-CoA dehydrogenase